jgi:hypothetical protein
MRQALPNRERIARLYLLSNQFRLASKIRIAELKALRARPKPMT